MLNTNAASEFHAASTDEQQRDIPAAIDRAKCALDDIKKKVAEYDAQYKASESASGYMRNAIEQANSAFDQLSAQAAALKDATAEVPAKALSSAFAAANVALEQVPALATKYDEQFQLSGKVAAAVEVPRQRTVTALAEASELTASVSAAANAQLQGVNQGILQRSLSFASQGAGFLFSTAAALNERYDIESKALTAGTVAVDKASAVDERFNVSETVQQVTTSGVEMAQGIDSRFTGGKVAPVVQSAYDQGFQLAMGGLSFLATGYETAKQQRLAGGAPPAELPGKDVANADPNTITMSADSASGGK